jgi:hypothetical protein
MRADVDATERSGESAATTRAHFARNPHAWPWWATIPATHFSALIAFLLMIAVRPQYSWSEGGINPLGNGIDRMLLHPLGLSFEGIAGQETFTGDMAERYQRIERHHHVIDTPPRNLV